MDNTTILGLILVGVIWGVLLTLVILRKIMRTHNIIDGELVKKPQRLSEASLKLMEGYRCDLRQLTKAFNRLTKGK